MGTSASERLQTDVQIGPPRSGDSITCVNLMHFTWKFGVRLGTVQRRITLRVTSPVGTVYARMFLPVLWLRLAPNGTKSAILDFS